VSRTVKGAKGPGYELTDPRGGWVGEGKVWKRIHRRVLRARERVRLQRPEIHEDGW
jgi:hypothetical protein